MAAFLVFLFGGRKRAYVDADRKENCSGRPGEPKDVTPKRIAPRKGMDIDLSGCLFRTGLWQSRYVPAGNFESWILLQGLLK